MRAPEDSARHIRELLETNARQALQIERLDKAWSSCQQKVSRLQRQLDDKATS